MTPRQILAGRVADRVAPRLFAFAYPSKGRGFGLARRLALRLWRFLLRIELARADLLP